MICITYITLLVRIVGRFCVCFKQQNQGTQWAATKKCDFSKTKFFGFKKYIVCLNNFWWKHYVVSSNPYSSTVSRFLSSTVRRSVYFLHLVMGLFLTTQAKEHGPQELKIDSRSINSLIHCLAPCSLLDFYCRTAEVTCLWWVQIGIKYLFKVFCVYFHLMSTNAKGLNPPPPPHPTAPVTSTVRPLSLYNRQNKDNILVSTGRGR